MSRYRSSVLTVVLASACGPIVPFAGDGGSDDGDTDDDDDDDDGDDDDEGDDEGDDDRPSDEDDGEVGGEIGGNEFDIGSTVMCGDGIVDADEECDDANDVPNDGCEPDCTGTPPGTLLHEIIGNADSDDVARAVALAQDGTLLVAGSSGTNGLDQLWVHAENFDVGSTSDSFAPSDQDEYGTSIAVVGDLAFVVGLRPDSDSAVLLRYDSALAEIPGGPTDIIPFGAVASPTAEGFVVVTNGGGFGDFVANVRRFDSAGVMIADVPQEPGIFVGVATPDPLGGTILGGGTFGGEGSAVWLSAITSDGSTSWVWGEEAQPGVEVRLRGLATAADGRIVGVGTRGLEGPGPDEDGGWIWWWTADGQLETDGPLEIGGAAARPSSVVVGANGIVVGGTTIDIEDGFVAGFDTAGELQWGHQIIGDLGVEDGVLALAIDPGNAVYAVGWVTRLGTSEDYWIGAFSD